MKNYELIEHTADIGVRVRGGDLKELFANAAGAMFDLIAEQKLPPASHQPPTKDIVRLKADDLDELFINWLNELLSLSGTKEKIFCEFDFKNLDKHNLEAEISGCDIKNYKVNTEIKAATYHQLKIEETKSGWQAEVIFDV